MTVLAAIEFVRTTFAPTTPAATWAPVRTMFPALGTTGSVPGAVKASTSIFVVAPPPPTKVTKPLASTLNPAESKAARPIFVASVATISCAVWTSIVTVLPEPVVSTGVEPAATEVPRISRVLAIGTAFPESVTKSVGIDGLFPMTSISPACEITTSLLTFRSG